MDIAGYMRAIRSRLPLVIIATFLGALLGLVSVLRSPVAYTSTVSLYVSAANANSAGDLNEGSAYVQNQMANYAEMANSPIVLDPVIGVLHLQTDAEALASDITAEAGAETAILKISASQPTAEGAKRLATALGDQTVKTLSVVTPQTTKGEQTVQTRVIATASTPASTGALSRFVPIVLGGVAGCLLGCLAVLAMNWVATRSAPNLLRAKTSREDQTKQG